jgi:hypothetical protein
VRVAFPLDPNYFRAFAVYYMACFCAVRQDFENAAYYADRIEFDAPPDGTDFLPYDLRQATRLVAYRQQDAIERGARSVIITSLTKSASAFLSNALAAIVDVPILRLSVGEGLESFPVPKWVRQVARGGTVTHEHIEAMPSHLAALRAGGLTDVWVQIREPRDAAHSLFMMTSNGPTKYNPQEFFIKCSAKLSQWLDRWIVASESGSHGLNIRFVTFEEVTRNFQNTARSMLDGWITPEISGRLRRFAEDHQPSQGPNFRKGRGGEWRDAYDASVSREAWTLIPDRVKALLDLQP